MIGVYILFVIYDWYALGIFIRAKSLNGLVMNYTSRHDQKIIACNSGAKIAPGAKHVAICETCSRPIKQYVTWFC